MPLSGAEGIRTPDLLRAREALSQLSYSPVFARVEAADTTRRSPMILNSDRTGKEAPPRRCRQDAHPEFLVQHGRCLLLSATPAQAGVQVKAEAGAHAQVIYRLTPGG